MATGREPADELVGPNFDIPEQASPASPRREYGICYKTRRGHLRIDSVNPRLPTRKSFAALNPSNRINSFHENRYSTHKTPQRDPSRLNNSIREVFPLNQLRQLDGHGFSQTPFMHITLSGKTLVRSIESCGDMGCRLRFLHNCRCRLREQLPSRHRRRTRAKRVGPSSRPAVRSSLWLGNGTPTQRTWRHSM